MTSPAELSVLEIHDAHFKSIYEQLNTHSKNTRSITEILKLIQRQNKTAAKTAKVTKKRFQEKLNLSNDIFGKCNPKSTTGRLDIFCRTILDYSNEYEKVPINFNGEIFLEITSRSFDISLSAGDSLNQLRLISKKHNYIIDKNLNYLHRKYPIVLDKNKKKISENFPHNPKSSVTYPVPDKIEITLKEDILIWSKILLS